jgi:hypothetical protein
MELDLPQAGQLQVGFQAHFKEGNGLWSTWTSVDGRTQKFLALDKFLVSSYMGRIGPNPPWITISG